MVSRAQGDLRDEGETADDWTGAVTRRRVEQVRARERRGARAKYLSHIPRCPVQRRQVALQDLDCGLVQPARNSPARSSRVLLSCLPRGGPDRGRSLYAGAEGDPRGSQLHCESLREAAENPQPKRIQGTFWRPARRAADACAKGLSSGSSGYRLVTIQTVPGLCHATAGFSRDAEVAAHDRANLSCGHAAGPFSQRLF